MKKLIRHITPKNTLMGLWIAFCLYWAYRWGIAGVIIPLPIAILCALDFKWD